MGSSSGRCENGHNDCTVIRCWVVAAMGMVGGDFGEDPPLIRWLQIQTDMNVHYVISLQEK